jgi:hypothetical protein
MSVYTIKHGSIAAVQYATDPMGKTVSVTDSKEPDKAKDSLPLPVLAAVNKQFGIVFSLPYERRQAFIDSSVPFEVFVADEI